MKTVNIQEAKTQLSKLVEEASKGESFVITKAGKPIVKVTAFSAPTRARVRRPGFMAEQISVPDYFDQTGRKEIERIFPENELRFSAASTGRPWGVSRFLPSIF